MNKLNNFLITVTVGFIFITCHGLQNSNSAKIESKDPLEFAKEFTSVCKVGINGGDGTLIEPKWVLTAGHVAEGMYRKTNGILFVNFENGTKYKVKNVFLHSKFEPMGLYDIALLELENEVNNITDYSGENKY